MRRFIVTLAFALVLPVVADAQNQSTTQMQLVQSPIFTTRLQYLGWQVAQEVLVEAATASAVGPIPAYTAPCHTRRVVFAQRFINSPTQGASEIAVGISGVNVSGAVIVGSVTSTGTPPVIDSSATDGAIQQAIRVLWNPFSGCATNP